MSLANQAVCNVAPKKSNRTNNANNVQSRWVFAVPKAHDAKTGATGDRLGKDEIEAMIAARIAARKSKDFAEADRLRKELDSRGIIIKDNPTGTTWDYSS